VERDFEERTRWAQSLEGEKKEAIAHFERAQGEAQEAWNRIEALERELLEAREALKQLQDRLWMRLGRKVGAIS
jgi:predicted nuclease with TOPRIM domain